jgi:flagellar biogenesis protein FliO
MAELQAAASLVAVLAVVLLAGLAARRAWPGAVPAHDASALRLRATLALDARRRLHLVDTAQGAALVLTGGTADLIVLLPAVPPA